MPERVLTLCVGISAYELRLLAQGEKPLQYLHSSAEELSAIFRSAWPSNGSRHLVTGDAEATRSLVADLIRFDTNSYDLFILYLAGHGRLQDGNFQFLFAADGDGPHLASSEAIDDLLSLAKAKHAVLFLDACHAGRYLEETSFFRSVAADRARVCLASSLPEQSSWEDGYFKRSLFADALTRTLTVPPGAVPAGAKRVEMAFEEVAADVARHAFALKGSVAQEPAMSLASTVSILLPLTVRVVDRPAAMTTYQTLLRRSRQISVATAIVVVVAACAISAATWRPALNGSGLVELRPGPKWLSPLNQGPWRLRVETEASIADLKSEQDYPSLRAAIRDETGIHAWPGSGSSSVRRWADFLINEQLDDANAARWRVRLGYSDAVEQLKSPDHILRTRLVTPLDSATRLAAEAKALAPERDLSDVWSIQWAGRVAPGSCDQSIPSGNGKDQLALYLSSESSEIIEWLRGLALTARVDASVDLDRAIAVAKMFSSANRLWNQEYSSKLGAPGEPITGASISARFNERPTPAEVAALAQMVTSIIEGRIERKAQLVTINERADLLGLMTGCNEIGVHVLAAAGDAGDPSKVVQWARARKRADQGRIPLLLLAARGALPEAEITRTLMESGFGDDVASKKRAFVYTREWLTSLTEVSSLPQDLLHGIAEYAAQRNAMGDEASSGDALVLLARAFRSIRSEDRAKVQSFLTPPASALSAMPVTLPTIAQLGLLAWTGTTLSSAQRAVLMGIIGESSPNQSSKVSFVDADKSGREDLIQLVPGLTSTHLLAFSRMVIGAKDGDPVRNDPRTLPFLERSISDGIRFGVRANFLRTIVTAAASVRLATEGMPSAGAILSRLRGQSDDATARFATSSIAVAELRAITPAARTETLRELRHLWSIETEPEIKLSLAATIVGAIFPLDALPRLTR